MALVTRFEDLQAWQEARRLAARAFEITQLSGFRRDRNLVDQLRRASVSAMNNIAEGFDSGSHNEFGRFLRYAVRSASEVQSCLYVAIDRGYIGHDLFGEIYESARRVKSFSSALLQRVSTRPARRSTGEGMVKEDASEWPSRPIHPGCYTSAPPHLRTSARSIP